MSPIDQPDSTDIPTAAETHNIAKIAGIDSDAVERWFVRRGVPQAIHRYNATEDILTRMTPAMLLLFIVGAVYTFGDRFTGWDQSLVVITAFFGFGALGAIFNKLRGRRWLELPEDIEIYEVAFFILGAPILATIMGTHDLRSILGILAFNLVNFVLLFLATLYGLIPMLLWGLREVLVQVRGMFALFARMLPMLMLFATFLFINAEVWQVAHDMTEATFAVVSAMILLPVVFPVVMRSGTEVRELHRFESWKEIDEICASTQAPLPPPPIQGAEEQPELVPLDEGERRNLALLVIVAQIVQVILVALMVGAFFLSFGFFAIRQETLLQWAAMTTEEFKPLFDVNFFGAKLVFTRELVRVSSMIAGISALQFSVSIVNDDKYRHQFNASLESEIREILAVRARYLESMYNTATKYYSPNKTPLT